MKRFVFIILTFFAIKSGFTEDEISVLAIFPLSGPLSSIGEQNRIGTQIALDEINQTGGINGRKLKIFIEDSQTDPKLAISIYRKYVSEEKIKIVITALTSVALALRPLAENDHVLLIAESVHPTLVNGYKYIIRFFYSIAKHNDLVASFIEENNINKVAVLHAEEEWGQIGFQDLKDKIGNRIIEEETFAKNASDLIPQLLKIKAKNPELVYILGVGSPAAIAYKQIKVIGLKTKIIGIGACSFEDIFIPAKEFLEGIYSLEPDLDEKNPIFKILSDKIKEKFPTRIVTGQITIGYDRLKILAEALKNNNFDAQNIKNYITSQKEFSGASGRISFNQEGDSTIPSKITIEKNQKCLDLN